MSNIVMSFNMIDNITFSGEKKAVLICFVSHSGKTIPNGTDKNQLGTPENEGKFQKYRLCTVKEKKNT